MYCLLKRYMEQIKLRLKELRLEKKLTQQQLATVLNISRAVYCRYENGTRTAPLEVLWELADFYGESVDYLIGRTKY